MGTKVRIDHVRIGRSRAVSRSSLPVREGDPGTQDTGKGGYSDLKPSIRPVQSATITGRQLPSLS